MKVLFLAACLSLSSALCAAQGRGAAGRESGAAARNGGLLSCVKGGDADCVARALAEGADASAADKEGVAALTLAAEGRSARVVELLLGAGADANRARPGEGTPLCRAALFGRREIAEALLEKGAKVNVVCGADHGDSPLMDALRGAMYGDLPAGMKEALAADLAGGDADAPDAPDKAAKLREVLGAPREDFLAIARLLLAHGADPNVVARCDVGETALLYAAMGANVEMVKALLARGADVNKGAPALSMLRLFEIEDEKARGLALPTLSQEQAAMLAWNKQTAGARAEVKRLLKAAGAKEVEPEDGGDEPPAPAGDAAKEAAREVFADLVESDDVEEFRRLADAYAAHPLGAEALPEALRLAVIYRRTAMIKILLERGVSPDPPGGAARGDTPLMQAAYNGDAEYVRMLLDAGADAGAKNGKGQTALDYAELWSRSEEHRAVVKLLLGRGAKRGDGSGGVR